MCIISKIQYILPLADIKKNHVLNIYNILRSFIWNKRKTKVIFSLIKGDIKNGYMDLRDISTMNKVAKLIFVPNILQVIGNSYERNSVKIQN
jgi:hypothetical protein